MAEQIKQTYGKEAREGHLGGCYLGGDPGTYYPRMWEYLVKEYKLESVLDIGCGAGHSSKFFADNGCEVVGVDGSIGAMESFLLPGQFILNDYEEGSAITEKNIEIDGDQDEVFDLCWSCEFVEHVWEKYSQNFINDFAKCKYLAMTFAGPGQGGYHHVNLQPAEYWIEVMEKNGFTYLSEETEKLRGLCKEDYEEQIKSDVIIPWNGKKLSDGFNSHFMLRGLFFARK